MSESSTSKKAEGVNQSSVIIELIRSIKDYLKGRPVVSVMALMFAVLICYQVYANNTSLSYVISQAKRISNFEPQMDESTYPQIASELIKNGATSVSIFSVNIGAATRKLEYSQINNDIQKNHIGDQDFLYVRLSDADSIEKSIDKSRYNDAIHALQNGEFVCGNHVPSTRYGFLLREKSVVTGCAIGIPSGLSYYFVGIISVGFNREITASERDLLRSELFRYSQKIISN
jgi:hypothetical protein